MARFPFVHASIGLCTCCLYLIIPFIPNAGKVLIYRIGPNYRTVRLGFSKLLGTLICGKICIYLLRIHYKKDQKKDLFDDDYVIVSDFLYKGICCGHSFELHQQVNAIQMSTHNICF